MALLDSQVALLENAFARYFATGEVPGRQGTAHPLITPFQAFATADGHITIAAAKQHFWVRLCEAIGRRDLLEDPRYATFALRNEHRDELLAELDAVFASRPSDHWVSLLVGAGVPVGRVNEVAEALEDPQTVARGTVVEVQHPNLGTVREIATPLHLSGELPEPVRAPFLGEHTEELLHELCGYSEERMAQLREIGAFGERRAPAADRTAETI